MIVAIVWLDFYEFFDDIEMEMEIEIEIKLQSWNLSCYFYTRVLRCRCDRNLEIILEKLSRVDEKPREGYILDFCFDD